MRAILGNIFKFFYRIKPHNRENEIFDKPFIVCANHTSMLDVGAIVMSMKTQIRFMAKKEAFKVPVLNWFIKSMGAFPVDRKGGDVGAIKKAISMLKEGECIGIFPQGTRIPYVNPRETEVKDGVGMIATRAGVGVIPVFIKNKSGKLKVFRRNDVIIGKYISPEEIAFPELSGKEKYKAISEYIFDKVCALGEGWEGTKK
jgi:1-acyl-sn-glycerol-3-phosphate acyltransferase